MPQRAAGVHRFWIKEAKRLFHEFIHNLNLNAERRARTLELRTYHEH